MTPEELRHRVNGLNGHANTRSVPNSPAVGPSPDLAYNDDPVFFRFVAVPPHQDLAGIRGKVPETSWQITRLQEVCLLATAVTAYCLTAVLTIRHSIAVYLPPDAAHYLGEADNFLGRGVLGFTHPPAFPLLTAAARAAVGPLSAVLVAMAVGLALAYVSIYLLLRQWLPVFPALFGTSVGLLMPITAELLGWAGGAELLGFAFGMLTLACFEWWCRCGGYRGFAVGVAFGLTIMSHPFGALVAALCLGVRWIVEITHRRRLDTGWEPTGLRGLCSVLVATAPLAVYSLSYYTGVDSPGSVTLGLPAPSTLSTLLTWSTERTACC